jgi:hypothetical protein
MTSLHGTPRTNMLITFVPKLGRRKEELFAVPRGMLPPFTNCDPSGITHHALTGIYCCEAGEMTHRIDHKPQNAAARPNGRFLFTVGWAGATFVQTGRGPYQRRGYAALTRTADPG